MIQIESPGAFWLAVLLAPLLLFAWRKSYADLPSSRRWLSLILRSLAFALILFGLSKPLFLLENKDQSILFLLDVSDSSSDAALEKAWQSYQDQTSDLSKDQKAALLVFAGQPRLLQTLQSAKADSETEIEHKIFHRRREKELQQQIQEIERGELTETARLDLEEKQRLLAEIRAWRDDISVAETNVESALRLARGVLPNDTFRRLVLWSDGNQTRGDFLQELALLKKAEVSVYAHLLAKKDTPEVLAESLRLPSEVQVMEPFDLELNLQANYKTPAKLRIYRNRFLVTEKEIQLKSGKNILEVPKLRLEEGFHEFEAIVAAAGDETLENNMVRAAIRVSGRPKVLFIEEDPLAARYLEEALAAEEIHVEVRPSGGIPEDMNDLLNYEALILSNVAANSMRPEQMGMIKRYVREMGGGLVMIGGEKSFGLGGYYRTPIEEALPVRMPIRKNVEKPNLGLILVLDKSGSMGGHKIELAKEAAIASAEVLKPRDLIGVVAFDGLPEWIVHLTDATELDAITQLVARLDAGGGTNIYNGLYEAYQALLESDAKLKHIILLSDGITQGSGYRELVSHIAADDITLSTVGIGEGVDVDLLQGMAEWAGGECYLTNDFQSIPQIFTRETLRASKSMMVEEPFIPQLVQGVDAVKGIDFSDAPFLLGYVATSPKETATVSLASEYGDPILATWRFGLGRSAAFTSDAKAQWAGDWISWENFSKFWGQLLRSVMSTGTHRELRSRSRVSVDDATVNLSLDVRGRSGAFRDDFQTEISLFQGDQAPKPLTVVHEAPGLFKTKFPIENYGEFYRLLVVQSQGEGASKEIVDMKTLAVTESYSPEFRNPLPDETALRTLAEETQGKFQESAAPWDFDGEPARTPKETWWWWILAAVLLLPLDIAVRRLP
ncbi:MAG: VWA domain-containing protein [Planctomycetota bacterium]|nr:MAG: VWA domain-containing protein [Planctomycetota bacterium]